jgi:hypothetical protein
MHTSVFLVIFFLSPVLSQVSASVTTSDVAITLPPSTPTSGLPGAFIGYSYISQLPGYSPWFCTGGSTWSSLGNYAACCDGNTNVECFLPTACLNTSLLVGPMSIQISTCTGTAYATSCITGTVYDSIGSNQSVTNIECWPGWSGGNWQATRGMPSTLTHSSHYH